MRVCVDLDDTICESNYPLFGKLLAGAKESIAAIKQAGHYITILSCRTGEELVPNALARKKQKYNIIEFLQKNDIPFDEVYEGIGKPIADAYIDNNGIEFKDNWDEIAERIINDKIRLKQS
jgi:hypothetical protein